MTSVSLSNDYVADTMAIVLHLERPRSTALVQQIFSEADLGNLRIHIPAVVLAEVLYLSEKGRISLSLQDVRDHIVKHPSFTEVPLDIEIVDTAGPIKDIPELHDRLIASTARFLGLELITNDTKIRSSAFVRTVW